LPCCHCACGAQQLRCLRAEVMMRTNGACAAIMCVVASLFLTCAQEPEPSNCTSCSTLMELSVCTADVNRACCRQGGCESGEPSTCDLGCSSVLLPMSRACAGFLDANYGLLAISKPPWAAQQSFVRHQTHPLGAMVSRA
jgi:hypothetical protein